MAHIDEYRAKRIHMVGIGGCSMSGLALILQSKGYEVTGSDRSESQFTALLKEAGIPVFIGHDAKNVQGAGLLCYSAAIKPDNPERLEGKRLGIGELERSSLLGQLSAQYERCVCVAGCHGKTTITSMLALISETANLGATVHIGGFVSQLGGGVLVRPGKVFITEACEYVRSFLTLNPTIALINNIDNDHLDCFKDIEEITDVFRAFIGLLPQNGVLFGCVDDPRVKGLIAEAHVRTVTYGRGDARFTPKNIRYDELGCATFGVMDAGTQLGEITLDVPGAHNVINALGALSVGIELGADFESCVKALKTFRPAKRRFEYMGELNGAKVFHDYAHHPAEIKACMDAASRYPHGRLFVVFQCNSFTRAKTLFLNDVDCFGGAFEVLVPDIYPGREVDKGEVHARQLTLAINEAGTSAKYIATFEEIRKYLDENLVTGDLVVTLGSGDVYGKTKLLLD